jgi:hypothetical protein
MIDQEDFDARIERIEDFLENNYHFERFDYETEKAREALNDVFRKLIDLSLALRNVQEISCGIHTDVTKVSNFFIEMDEDCEDDDDD